MPTYCEGRSMTTSQEHFDCPTMGDLNEVNARLVPIILGSDILGYSYVRAFDETYNLKNKPIVLATQDVKYMTSSKLCECRIVDGVDNEDVLCEQLKLLGEELAAKNLRGLLLGSGDWYARTLSKHKQELQQWHYVPYIDFELLDFLTKKDNFYALCDEYGLDHPKTLALECAADAEVWDGDMHGIEFPCIAKPSNSAAWHYAEFEGKQKIHEPQSAEELNWLYTTLKDKTSYDRLLLVQDKIPGGDNNLLSLTAYIGKGGTPVVNVLGQVVLQDHTPLALGNPVCIVSALHSPALDGRQDELRELTSRAIKMLADRGYTGYANFDIMYDRRDGSFNFFEVNTRPGRNTFYVTLAATPFIEPIVREVVMGRTIRDPYGADEFCYTCIPSAVIRRHVSDEKLREYVLGCYRNRLAQNPLFYRGDTPEHDFWSKASTYNHIRKFKRWMPAED